MYSGWYHIVNPGGYMKKIFTAVLAAVCTAALCISCQQAEGGSAADASAPSVSSVPASPSGLAVNAAASSSYQVGIRWNAVSGATGYNLYKYSAAGTYTLYKSGLTETSCDDSDSAVTSATSGSYCVTALNAAGESALSSPASVTFVPSEKKTSDWLILYYADGDNNLVATEWLKEQEFSKGLYDIGGKSTYDTVNVVTLWDGSAYASDVQIPLFFGNVSGSYLLQLNPDATALSAADNGLNCSNYSYTASWLTDSNGNQEVDMASKDTLINFLLWAKGRYSATHTMLIICDHGAGPVALPLSSRAVCQDHTSAKAGQMIMSNEMPAVFKTAGYGPDAKLDVLFMDTCLEGSLEEAYEVKDYASYYAASANTSNAGGFREDDLLTYFTKDAAPEAVGKAVVKVYKDTMRSSNNASTAEEWKAFKTFLDKANITELNGSPLTADKLSYTYGFLYGHTMINGTMALYDLSKIGSLAALFDSLAETLNNGTGEQQAYIINNYLKSSSPVENTLMSNGSIYNLFDIGYFSYQLQMYADSIASENSAWSAEIKSKVSAVQGSLSETILASWHDMYKDGSEASVPSLYCSGCGEDTTAAPFNNNWFGMTIAGGFNDVTYWYGNRVIPSANQDLRDWYVGYYVNQDFSIDYPAWNTLMKANLVTE
jgi:hypothetical protein